ncbi:unnamed protein product [Alternaria burnsii]|nr:unnamed protein product [Alternaria burnsii]
MHPPPKPRDRLLRAAPNRSRPMAAFKGPHYPSFYVLRFRPFLTGTTIPASHCLTPPQHGSSLCPQHLGSGRLRSRACSLGAHTKGATCAAVRLLDPARLSRISSTPRPPIDPFIHGEPPRTTILSTLRRSIHCDATIVRVSHAASRLPVRLRNPGMPDIVSTYHPYAPSALICRIT